MLDFFRRLLSPSRRIDSSQGAHARPSNNLQVMEGLQANGFDLHSFCEELDGLCYPDWEAVFQWMDEHGPQSTEELEDAWTALAIDWFELLRAALGSRYSLLRSPRVLLLHALPPRQAELLLVHCEKTLARSAAVLEGCKPQVSFGPIGFMNFHDRESFIRYVDYFARPGEQPETGGMFLQPGYGHMVTFGNDLNWIERVAAHELGHAQVQHLPHPRWLGEALAMDVETHLCGESMHRAEQLRTGGKHATHWTEETIQQFWTGESFLEASDAFELSYSLAEVLFQRIKNRVRRDRGKLAAFIDEACYTDAGASAAREFLGFDLGEHACSLLGPGQWAPNQERVARFFDELQREDDAALDGRGPGALPD